MGGGMREQQKDGEEMEIASASITMVLGKEIMENYAKGHSNVKLTSKGKGVLSALEKLGHPECDFVEDEYYTYSKMKDGKFNILLVDKQTGERMGMV